MSLLRKLMLLLTAAFAATGQSQPTFVTEYWRKHDFAAFAKSFHQAQERGHVDLEEPIKIIADAFYSSDPQTRTSAFSEFRAVAGRFTVGLPLDKQLPVSALFAPIVTALGIHEQEAKLNPRSEWAGQIVALTAMTGIQPSPAGLEIIYRWLDLGEPLAVTFRIAALSALARLQPLPDRARAALLDEFPKKPLHNRLELMAMAAADPEIRSMFSSYLTSAVPAERREALKTMLNGLINPAPFQSILDQLRKRDDLEPESRNILELVIRVSTDPRFKN